MLLANSFGTVMNWEPSRRHADRHWPLWPKKPESYRLIRRNSNSPLLRRTLSAIVYYVMRFIYYIFLVFLKCTFALDVCVIECLRTNVRHNSLAKYARSMKILFDNTSKSIPIPIEIIIGNRVCTCVRSMQKFCCIFLSKIVFWNQTDTAFFYRLTSTTVSDILTWLNINYGQYHVY